MMATSSRGVVPIEWDTNAAGGKISHFSNGSRELASYQVRAFFLRSCCVDGKLTLWIRVFNCKFHRSRKSHAKPLCRSFAVEGRLMWIFLDFHAEEN